MAASSFTSRPRAGMRNDSNRLDGMLTAVPIEPGTSFRFGAAVPLFNVGRYVNAAWRRSYDVSRDGKRFLFLRLQALTPPPALVVVLIWQEELKARMRQK
jgi:hypothetical protein